MLLAVNANNTRTTIGVFSRGELLDAWRISTQPARTADELATLFRGFLELRGLSFDRNITGVAVASVVPAVTRELKEMVPRYFHFEPFVVEPGIRTGIQIRIDNPREVGADRVCNAVAAFELYGGPALVVDLGTATTFDAVSADGAYLGGAIAPGLEISVNALANAGAMLRRVELVAPPGVIGKNTVEAMQSGAVYGYACLVEGMVERFRKELGGGVTTILTGGLADVLLPHLSGIDAVDAWLVLKGLRLLFDRNTPRE